jgi:hypothetical protein
VQQKQLPLINCEFKTRGSHSSVAEDPGLLGYGAVSLGEYCHAFNFMVKQSMKKMGLPKHEYEGTKILQNNTLTLPEDLDVQF